MNNTHNTNIWQSAIMGLVVADALGVPVEFMDREQLDAEPVTTMREYGTHHQPKGTWSDDSSMTLATVASIKENNGINYRDLMDKFSSWMVNGEFTPFGEVFDAGISTSRAIMSYGKGISPLECGEKGEYDNGNGSLMRILPVCLYCFERQKMICTSEDEAIQMIHNVSALTHGHLRSQIACGLYYFMVKALLEKNGTLRERLQSGVDKGFSYYTKDLRNLGELSQYDRLRFLDEFAIKDRDQINSSGYVVDTIEAAVWCLITTSSYEECVLKAVNLGRDTDTVAAVAGGLAGLYYGYGSIPGEWLDAVQKKEWIDELCSV